MTEMLLQKTTAIHWKEYYALCKPKVVGLIIFTALVGIVFLYDPVTWRFWVGSLLILGSVMLLNVGNVKGSV